MYSLQCGPDRLWRNTRRSPVGRVRRERSAPLARFLQPRLWELSRGCIVGVSPTGAAIKDARQAILTRYSAKWKLRIDKKITSRWWPSPQVGKSGPDQSQHEHLLPAIAMLGGRSAYAQQRPRVFTWSSITEKVANRSTCAWLDMSGISSSRLPDVTLDARASAEGCTSIE